MRVRLMIIRNSKQFGEIVRATRLKQGLRQADLARKASVRQALISDLETGVTNAKLETVVKIIAALGLDLSIVQRQQAEFDPLGY